MRHWIGRRDFLRLIHSLVLGGAAGMALLHSSLSAAEGLPRFEMSLGADYRLAKFDWSIAGDLAGANPNVLSELTWRDLEIPQVNAVARVGFGDNVVLQAYGDYGQIINGENQDSDYLGDNRSLEFSRSNNDGRGNIDDLNVALGYHFLAFDPLAGHYAHITPLAGYSLHHQNLKIKNGVQTIPATGPLADLDSRYDAQWEGPWVGLNLRLEAGTRTALLIDMAYHWADYSAEADWNLRDDLSHPVSYRHDTNGRGVVAVLGVIHTLSRHWEVLTRIESQHWSTDSGVDTVYLVDTSSGAVSATTTRLNGVHWKTRLLGVAAIYRF